MSLTMPSQGAGIRALVDRGADLAHLGLDFAFLVAPVIVLCVLRPVSGSRPVLTPLARQRMLPSFSSSFVILTLIAFLPYSL